MADQDKNSTTPSPLSKPDGRLATEESPEVAGQNKNEDPETDKDSDDLKEDRPAKRPRVIGPEEDSEGIHL